MYETLINEKCSELYLRHSSVHVAGDFELWARFWEHAELATMNALVGGYRMYQETKTSANYDTVLNEARMILARYGTPPPPSPTSVLWRRRLLNRFPSLGHWLGEKSLQVDIDPRTEACRVYYTFIV